MTSSELAAVRVPSMAGGVSRQPAHIRHPSQVADARNAIFDVRDGAGKRYGTELIGQVMASGGPGSDAKLRLHAIDRDGDERYLVVYGRNAGDTSYVLRVFQIEGEPYGWTLTEATITFASGEQTAIEAYLNSGSATDDDLRLLTIADTTFIANRTVTATTETSADYDIASVQDDFDALLRFTPANQTYHRTQDPTAVEPAGHYYYEADEDGTSTAVVFARRDFPSPSTGWTVPQNYADNGSGGNPFGFRVFMQRFAATLASVTYTHATKRLTKTGAFAGLTLRAGDQIRVTGGTGATAGYYTIASKVSDDTIELVDAPGTGDQADFTTEGIGADYEVVADFNGVTPTTMSAVASRFSRALQDAGCADGLIAWDASNDRMQITSPFRGTGAAVQATRAPTTLSVTDTTGANAPFYPTGSSAAGGTGDASTIGATKAPSERWIRVAAPAQASATPTNTTLPIQMVRTNPATPAFELRLGNYASRTSGDQTTNPAPRVFREGVSIADMAFQQDRLIFGGDEYIAWSATGDLLNFFIADAENPTDADPIDVSIGAERVSIIDYFVPFRRSLAIFTAAGRQYEVSTDGPITPTNIAVTPTTAYRSVAVRPVVMGPLMYFVDDRTADARVYEYFFDDATVSSAANEITAHVDGLIPSGVRTIAADPSNNTVLVLSGDADFPNDIWAWRGHWDGTRKVQSAWCRWRWDSGYRIVDIATMDGAAWMLVESPFPPDPGSKYYLERLPLSTDGMPKDAAGGEFRYEPHLDRRMMLTGTYDGVADETTFDIDPVTALGSTINCIVLGPDFASPGATVTDTANWTYTGTTIVVDGDYSDGEVILGAMVNWSIELSRPYRRDPETNAVVFEACHCKRLMTEFTDTGSFTITLDRDAGSDRTATFSDDNNRTEPFGHFKALLGENADRSHVDITDEGARPAHIGAVTWLLEVMPGGRI